MHKPANHSVPIRTHHVREAHLYIDAADIRHLATDVDVVVVRVSNLRGPNGRPVTRTLRLPADLLTATDLEKWN